MKKLVCVLLTLILTVSLTSAIAFAEDGGEVNPAETCFINFDAGADDAEGSMDRVSAFTDSDYKLPECGFTRQGHTFAGWRALAENNTELSETIYKPGDLCPIHYNTVFYAQWTETGDPSVMASGTCEAGHNWNAPTYKWAADYSTVTATRICKNDSSHKESETVKTTSKVTKAATYTAKGETTYIAVFANEAFSKQTKTAANIDKLEKMANPITVKAKVQIIKFAKLKKKTQTVIAKKAFTVSNPKGKVTYKVTKYDSKAKKKITVSSAGKVTIKKGLKKGTYKIKVKVTAAGNTQYKSGSKTVTLKIKVK